MELLWHTYVPKSGPNARLRGGWIDGYAASAVANATRAGCLNSGSMSNGRPTSSTGVVL